MWRARRGETGMRHNPGAWYWTIQQTSGALMFRFDESGVPGRSLRPIPMQCSFTDGKDRNMCRPGSRSSAMQSVGNVGDLQHV